MPGVKAGHQLEGPWSSGPGWGHHHLHTETETEVRAGLPQDWGGKPDLRASQARGQGGAGVYLGLLESVTLSSASPKAYRENSE